MTTSSRGLNSMDAYPQIKQAINEIFDKYGDHVSVDAKAKSILKFGRNLLCRTAGSTLMTLPTGTHEETYATGNTITKISSSASADNAKAIVVEGHTLDSGELTFVSQTLAFDAGDGQTPVDLVTPIARFSRIYNPGDEGAEWVGVIYVYEDDTVLLGVPQTAAKIHSTIRAGKQQSEKAATSTSNEDYLIITRLYGDVLKRGNAYSDIEFQWRQVGKIFRPITTFDPTKRSVDFNPFLVVPKNYDVRLIGYADQANTEISGGFQGYFAKVVPNN